MELVLRSANSYQISPVEDKMYQSDSFDRVEPDLVNETSCANPSTFGVDLQQKFFLAGFRDCRQEVLRYLVNIEQVPLEGPIIFGLEKHLTKLETLMQTSLDYSDCSFDYCKQSVISCTQQPSTSCEDSQVCSNKVSEHFHQSNLDDDTSSLHDHSSGHHLEYDVVGNAEENSSFDSGCDSSLVNSEANSSLVTSSETVAFQHSGSDLREERGGDRNDNSRERITDSELAENAFELMRLAQNNPSISRILNELFVLMDDDYDVTDDDDDDDEGTEMDSSMISEQQDDC